MKDCAYPLSFIKSSSLLFMCLASTFTVLVHYHHSHVIYVIMAAECSIFLASTAD